MKERDVWITKDGYGLVGMVYSGTRIDAVTPGSGAYHAGVERGMQLIEVDGRKVGSTNSVAGALAAAPHRFLIRVLLPETHYPSLDPPEAVALFQRGAVQSQPPPPTFAGPVDSPTTTAATTPGHSAGLAHHRKLSPPRRNVSAAPMAPPSSAALRAALEQLSAATPVAHPSSCREAEPSQQDWRVSTLQSIGEQKQYGILLERLERLEQRADASDAERLRLGTELLAERAQVVSLHDEVAELRDVLGRLQALPGGGESIHTTHRMGSEEAVPQTHVSLDCRLTPNPPPQEPDPTLHTRLSGLEEAIASLSDNISGVLSTRGTVADPVHIVERLSLLEEQVQVQQAQQAQMQMQAHHSSVPGGRMSPVPSSPEPVRRDPSAAENFTAEVVSDVEWLKGRIAEMESELQRQRQFDEALSNRDDAQQGEIDRLREELRLMRLVAPVSRQQHRAQEEGSGHHDEGQSGVSAHLGLEVDMVSAPEERRYQCGASPAAVPSAVDEDMWLELRRKIGALQERADNSDLRLDASLAALEQVNRAMRQLNERVVSIYSQPQAVRPVQHQHAVVHHHHAAVSPQHGGAARQGHPGGVHPQQQQQGLPMSSPYVSPPREGGGVGGGGRAKAVGQVRYSHPLHAHYAPSQR